jgi:uncharacterized protein YbjQ (UPF0145 family)/DNA-directed RNA polymerase subunit RPC12/RpoP
MSIEFKCPNCSADISAEEEEAGLIVECLACNSRLRVPADDQPRGASVVDAGRARPDKIPVSTTSAYGPFEIVAPISYAIGSRGGMKEEFELLKSRQSHVLSQAKRLGQLSREAGLGQTIGSVGVSGEGDLGLGVRYSGASFLSTDLEIAFMIAVSQIQFRASYLGANAVFGFRWDIDVDSNANAVNFLGTAYGTAVIIPKT